MAVTVSRQSVELNFEIDKGATFSHQITWKTGPTGSEVPVDLTGYSASFQIYDTNGTTPKFEVDSVTPTANGSIITLGGATGVITLKITDEDTAAFAFNNVIYNLDLTDTADDVRRLCRGKIKCFNEASK